MSRGRSNAVRQEEVEDMESTLQEVVPMPTHAAGTESKNLMNVAVHSAPNRAIAPLVLLGILILLFFVSPYLPIGVREYISALTR